MSAPRFEPREGWNVPRPEHIPRATPWPAAMAMGVTVFAWGLVASTILLGAGLVMIVVSLGGWIGELRHERRER